MKQNNKPRGLPMFCTKAINQSNKLGSRGYIEWAIQRIEATIIEISSKYSKEYLINNPAVAKWCFSITDYWNEIHTMMIAKLSLFKREMRQNAGKKRKSRGL